MDHWFDVMKQVMCFQGRDGRTRDYMYFSRNLVCLKRSGIVKFHDENQEFSYLTVDTFLRQHFFGGKRRPPT